MLLSVCLIVHAVVGTLICDDDKCNAIGTEHCNNGRCVCKSGFDGFHCNSCQEGHFGENCHPVDECCGHELKKVHSLEVDSERRVRRDTVDNTMRNSELRAMIRLDEIKERLENLWRDVTKAPFTDDLHMYIADITQRISKLIEMINELTPMFTDDIENTYFIWNQTTSDSVSNLWTKILDMETTHNNVDHRKQDLDEIQSALANLTGVEEQVRDAIHEINQIGIDLERNYEIAIRGAAAEFKTDEVFQLKQDLINSLTEIHTQIYDTFYEPGNGAPLYDTPEALAANLTAIVLESTVQLPHGWPSASSWLDEALFAQDTIERATDVSLKVLAQIDSYIELIEQDIDALKHNLTIVNGWKDEVIDERDLIIYIDLLYSMTENFDSDVNTDQTDKLFETMEKVRKVEHQFNKLGLVYKGVPVDNLTPSQITEIKARTQTLLDSQEQLKQKQDETNERISDIYERLNTVTSSTRDLNQDLSKIQTAANNFGTSLDEIETMLDQPAAESLKKLEDKSAIIHDQNDQLNTLEGEITGIIDEIKKLADAMSTGSITGRKRRSHRRHDRLMKSKKSRRLSRHRRVNKKVRRQSEQAVTVKEVEDLMGNIDKLIKEVEDYRDATTEINWKQYLEFVKVRQDESEDLDLPDVLSQVCHGGDKKCDSVEDYEQHLETEIIELRKRADSAMSDIRSCVADPCWSSSILSNHDVRPSDCP